ncbi:MAG: hypothetical protein ABI789_02615 [Usitatibacter sp.]
MQRVLLMAMLGAFGAASVPAHCDEAVAAIGKQRAAASAFRWDVRDVDHPLMGPIKFAVPKSDIATPVRNQKILSLAYVSCQRSKGTVAIELTNAPASDPAAGLGPVDLPRLVCHTPGPFGGTPVKSELDASWEISTLGDALARGLSPSELRRCVSIDVLQNVALPRGWGQESQRIAIEITPYARELDTVFRSCGESTAFAPDEPPPAANPAKPISASRPSAARLSSPPAAAPKIDPGPRAAEAPWKPARTILGGKTNVRSAASVASSVVIQLEPGAKILTQRASPDWWKVKPGSGAGFAGYIRGDRLIFE